MKLFLKELVSSKKYGFRYQRTGQVDAKIASFHVRFHISAMSRLIYILSTPDYNLQASLSCAFFWCRFAGMFYLICAP